MNKVFGIGLSRTGTTSLWSALNEIGIKSKKFPRIFKFQGEKVGKNGELIPINLDTINNYQGWVDTPVARFYKILDKEYPNSKFILTIRDINDWLLSCKHFFHQVSDEKENIDILQLHFDLYSAIEYNKERFRKAYKIHIRKILYYFMNRREDLLIFNLCGGDGWKKLCSFLNKPIPNKIFPKKNVNTKIH